MRARPARPRRASRALTLGAGSLAIALVLAACGSNEEPAEEPQAQPTEEPAPVLWPLTGLPVEGELPERPVIVVKVDNTTQSAPQVGLGSADLVAEELVEGGTTRLAAFFHTTLPREVGPVRSSRATDIGVVKPTEGVLVASGGAPATVNRLRQADIRTVTEGGPGYSRASDRSAPYNLMMNLRTLAKELETAEAPEQYLPWSEEDEQFSGRKATSVEAQFSPSRTTTWSFARGGWSTESGFSGDGDTFEPDTLLVLRVRVGDAGYLDPGGNPVPETKLEGRGQALVFHGGEVVRGTWTKGGPATPIELRTKNGPLTLPPGKVWMGLVPNDSGDVRFQP